MRFTFRYKLTFIIISLILSLLSGSFALIQNELESRFTSRIQDDLIKTRGIVRELMHRRYQTLVGQSQALENDLLIREILTDHSLDEKTRTDILTDEILPAFPTLNVLITLNPDGAFTAYNPFIQPSLDAIQQHPAIGRIMNGHPAPFYVFQQRQCIQLIGKPVFIREEMVGAIIIGQRLTPQVAEKIKHLSGADLAFFQQETVILSTQWSQDAPRQQHINRQIEAHTTATQASGQLLLNQENYIYKRIQTSDFLPAYILAKSLDQQLIFVQNMRDQIALVTLIGLILGSGVAFMFAHSISRPIRALTRATQEIERENYQHRVNIDTKDEFKQLAQSFNQMTQGLEERETLHIAMNQVVSTTITQALLDGRLNTQGEQRRVTLVCVGMRNFTAHAATIDASTALEQLNRYFTRMSFAIDSHNGMIDKYTGDQLIAIFGNPMDNPNHAQDALQAAETLIAANHQHNLECDARVELNVAIHSGDVITGYLGAHNRQNYSFVGAALATTQRCFRLAQLYHAPCVFTEHTLCAVNAQTLPAHRQLDRIASSTGADSLGLFQYLPTHDPSADASALALFQDAHAHFLQQRWSDAQTLLHQLLRINPCDAVSAHWLQRLAVFQQQPQMFNQLYTHGAYIGDLRLLSDATREQP